MTRVKHIKRGSNYEVLGRGKIQTDTPLTDYAEVVIYQSEEDDMIWVRPVAEFDDGRFAPMADATRTDLSQAAVAAALEAAAEWAGAMSPFGEYNRARDAIRALITPAQHDALAAHVAAEVTKARAEDAAKYAHLVQLVEVSGAMPEGFCCSKDRIGDDSKIHEPECRDLRAALGDK